MAPLYLSRNSNHRASSSEEASYFLVFLEDPPAEDSASTAPTEPTTDFSASADSLAPFDLDSFTFTFVTDSNFNGISLTKAVEVTEGLPSSILGEVALGDVSFTPDDFEGLGDSADFDDVDFAEPDGDEAGFEVVTFDDADFPDKGFGEGFETCVVAEDDFSAPVDFVVDFSAPVDFDTDFDTGFEAGGLAAALVAVVFTADLAPDDFEAGFAAAASFFFLISFFAIKTYHLSKLAKSTQNDSVADSTSSFGATPNLSAPLIILCAVNKVAPF